VRRGSMSQFGRSTAKSVGAFFGRRFARVAEINRKYKTPHVTMTPAVKFALLLLRLYLLLLVGLLFFKFFSDVVFRK